MTASLDIRTVISQGPGRTGKAILGFFVGDTLLYAMQFCSSIAIAKLYSVADFGFWQLARSLTPVLVTICSFGLPLYLLVNIPFFESQGRQGYVRSLIKRSILAAVLVSTPVGFILLMIAVARILPENYNIGLVFGTLFMMPQSLKRMINNVYISLRKNASIIAFNAIDLIVFSLLAIGVYALTGNIVKVLLAIVAGYVAVILIEVCYLFKFVLVAKRDCSSVPPSYLRLLGQSGKYARWSIPSSLMWASYPAIAVWMATCSGMEDVAYVGVAFMIGNAFFAPFARISDVLLQNLSRSYAHTPEIAVQRAKGDQELLLPFFILSLTLFMLFISVGIRFFLSAKYAKALPHIFILLASMPSVFLWYLMKNVPNSCRRIRLANFPEYVSFCIFAVLAYGLYPLWGGRGVLVAVLLARLFTNLFCFLLYGRYAAFSWRWLPHLPLIALAVMASWHIVWVVPYMVALICVWISQRDLAKRYYELLGPVILNWTLAKNE